MSENKQEGPDVITIPTKTYEWLKKEALWLEILRAAGVDNWEGLSFVHEGLAEDMGWKYD